MLALGPNCECCDCDLPPASDAAMICSFECTFCSDCAQKNFSGACPNCGGELVRRPIRPALKCEKFPPQTERVVKAHNMPVHKATAGPDAAHSQDFLYDENGLPA